MLLLSRRSQVVHYKPEHEWDEEEDSKECTQMLEIIQTPPIL